MPARVMLAVPVLVALVGSSTGCAIAPRPAGGRYWEKFPDPPGRSQGVSFVGEDRRGGLWVMSGTGTYCWDGRRRKWGDPVLRAGGYLDRLHGNARTGLYATQAGREDHWGEVHELESGRSEFVTAFYYDVPHQPPGFLVTGRDRFLNWGGGKLRILARGSWTEHPADLPQAGTLVFEGRRTVALYAAGRLYVVEGDDRVVAKEVDAGVNRKATKGAVWGGDRAMLLEYGGRRLSAFDLATGRTADTASVNEALGGRSVYDLFPTPDGDVWVLASDEQLSSYVLFQVRPDGTTALVRDTAGIPWNNHQFTQAPRSVLMDGNGAVWFAHGDVGVFRLAQGRIRQFDHRVDNSPASSTLLHLGGEGVIYAGSTGLHAYNLGASLTGAGPPTPAPTAALPPPVWTHRLAPARALAAAWCLEGLVLFVTGSGRSLTALDVRDGRERFSMPLSADEVPQLGIAAGGRDGELTLSFKDRIRTIDAATGAVIRSLDAGPDPRIAPIPVGDDYVIVKGYRGSEVARVDSSGRERWTAPLSGYVMVHPAMSDPVLLVQTREGSYGGQASWGIDVNTGRRLWQDTVDAYGHGAAFGGDAGYSVETAAYLAPDTTEAWLIARSPRSGERLWHYRHPGTTLEHAPLVDPARDLVYAVFDDGTVVCLDARTGTPVWERALPQPPARAPAASYRAYAPCMFLSDGALAVVTEDGFLHLLGADGRTLGTIALTQDVVRHGKRAGSPRMVAGPWLVGRTVVVALDGAIAAHPLAE